MIGLSDCRDNCLLEEMSSIYQPVERYGHSTVQVGNHLYMWGGRLPDSEKMKSMHSVVEVCHVPSGEWVQKPTTGDPPLGVEGYAAAVIRNEIFFYGGYNFFHDKHYHDSLYSFNVDTFNWKELSPTTSDPGPMMKSGSSMIAIKVNDEDYLAVIGGWGPSSNNTPKQPGAQYSERYDEWISPTVTGDRPPPIYNFSLSSITNTTAILFGGVAGHDRPINDNCTKFPNPGGSVQWPEGRHIHSSVLIDCGLGPHLLVVGGKGTKDCWLLNINKMKWKKLTNIPNTVTNRYGHSLSVWNETQTIHWIIVFGGFSSVTDTRLIKISHPPSTEDILDKKPQKSDPLDYSQVLLLII
uniref:Uncharacterized protein n=1 Tax=Amphimedon queenslandica TaxID=400682 RepID=A0A1X7U7C3_AMPQE